MENQNKEEINPLKFLNPITETEDVKGFLEESEKNGMRWLYIPLDDETIQLPINDLNKQVLLYMAKSYKDKDETVYIIGQKQFKIKPNDK